jgi:hypothetical protein
MSINFEVKSQLAKLLATEDLIVEHRHVETAMFNVHTRVLTLPMWKKASECVFDMLVSHEVGHALFTPDEWDWDTPKQFVNVVEDARIEKLMKRKYAGLAKTFYRGYEELSEEDFFALENEDIPSMNLADRANLYFKIGNYVNISFHNPEESRLIKAIADCETFADVLIVAEELYNFCKKNQEKDLSEVTHAPTQESSGSVENQNTSESSDGELDSESTESSEGESGEDSMPEIESLSSGGGSSSLEVKTAENLEDSISDLIDDRGADNPYSELTYLNIPDLDLKTVISSNSEIHDHINTFWSNYENDGGDLRHFDWADISYTDFKKSAQKEVNYLVKEFECRKSAAAYARASVSKTGVLDTSNLHTYKYNDDIFKKVTVLPDGKNHGLLFVLDWSGSMGTVMLDTMKQLFNLIWFCRKVSIPFDVYAFTNDFRCGNYDDAGKLVYPEPHYEKEDGLLLVPDVFSMMNILTSNVSNRILDKQMHTMFRIAFAQTKYVGYPVPIRMGLSGTPLNEALISLHKIIPNFKRQYSLEKVQCIVLTDGEASPCNRHVAIEHPNFERRIGTARLNANCYVRDRKIGTTYKVTNYHESAYVSFTNLMLTNLKDNFPNTNFVGIRVLSKGDSGSFIRLHGSSWEEIESMKTKWKKERCVMIKNSGYDTYIGLASSNLSSQTDFEVDDGATKAKIKSAFVKSLKTKKSNKKVLNEFVSLIA